GGQHFEDVSGNQPEYAGHAGYRRDGVDAQRHAVEERSAFFRTKEPQLQPVGLQRHRIHDFGADGRVLVEVAARLVEELARQRHVAIVDQVDLADVGDVGDAAAIGRGDHARDHSLETAPDVGEGNRHGSRTPAFGPGV